MRPQHTSAWQAARDARPRTAMQLSRGNKLPINAQQQQLLLLEQESQPASAAAARCRKNCDSGNRAPAGEMAATTPTTTTTTNTTSTATKKQRTSSWRLRVALSQNVAMLWRQRRPGRVLITVAPAGLTAPAPHAHLSALRRLVKLHRGNFSKPALLLDALSRRHLTKRRAPAPPLAPTPAHECVAENFHPS